MKYVEDVIAVSRCFLFVFPMHESILAFMFGSQNACEVCLSYFHADFKSGRTVRGWTVAACTVRQSCLRVCWTGVLIWNRLDLNQLAVAVMFVCNFTAEGFHSYAPDSWLAMLNRVCMTWGALGTLGQWTTSTSWWQRMGGVKVAQISNKGTIFKFLRHGKDRIAKFTYSILLICMPILQ